MSNFRRFHLVNFIQNTDSLEFEVRDGKIQLIGQPHLDGLHTSRRNLPCVDRPPPSFELWRCACGLCIAGFALRAIGHRHHRPGCLHRLHAGASRRPPQDHARRPARAEAGRVGRQRTQPGSAARGRVAGRAQGLQSGDVRAGLPRAAPDAHRTQRRHLPGRLAWRQDHGPARRRRRRQGGDDLDLRVRT